MSFLIKFFKKNSKLILISIICLVFLIANGQILKMYFWQDDFALLFKLQNPAGPAGSYGTGIIGQGPYKYFITMFVPFFPFFQLNALGYYTVGLLMCGIEVVIFYFIIKALLNNDKAAMIGSVIYAAGYIASDTLFRISNLWQTNLGVILALLALLFYIRFLYSPKNLKNYFLGLGFYFLAAELVYIRSHSLIIIFVLLDFLILLIPFRLKKLPGFVLRMTPFIAIFYYYYLKGGTAGGDSLNLILRQLLSGQISILASFFASLGNGLFPDKLQIIYLSIFHNYAQISLLVLFILVIILISVLTHTSTRTRILVLILFFLSFLLNKNIKSADLYWYRLAESFLSGAIGIYSIIFLVSLIIILWTKQKRIAVALLFGLIVLVSQIFGYYIKYPQAIFHSTHRYLSHAFIGYSIIFGVLIYLFYSKILQCSFIPKKIRDIVVIFPLLLIILPNLFFGFKYQQLIVENRSLPTQKFYQQLTQFVPEIKKGALFYFDINPADENVRLFHNFFSVGSMPNQTALAVFYHVDRYDLAMTTNLNELLYKLSTKENKIEDIYSFYFGEKKINNIGKNSSLINTTESFRTLLQKGSKEEYLTMANKQLGKLVWEKIKTSPAVPILLTLKLKITPDLNEINQITSSNFIDQSSWQKFINYFLNRQSYYQNVQVSSLSEWKYQEIYNVIDDDLNTSWRGSRIYWHDNKHERIVLDLQSSQNIAGIIWTNWNHTLTPTTYTIDVSLDNKEWKTVKKVVNGSEKKDGEVIYDKFLPTITRFVRMDITATLSNDAPALKEIEIVNSNDQEIDVGEVIIFNKDPLKSIKADQLDLIIPQLAPLINLTTSIKTDKGISTQNVPVNSFNQFNSYEYILMPGGTQIYEISINTSNLPTNIEFISASIRNLGFIEIQQRQLIKYLVK